MDKPLLTMLRCLLHKNNKLIHLFYMITIRLFIKLDRRHTVGTFAYWRHSRWSLQYPLTKTRPRDRTTNKQLIHFLTLHSHLELTYEQSVQRDVEDNETRYTLVYHDNEKLLGSLLTLMNCSATPENLFQIKNQWIISFVL